MEGNLLKHWKVGQPWGHRFWNSHGSCLYRRRKLRVSSGDSSESVTRSASRAAQAEEGREGVFHRWSGDLKQLSDPRAAEGKHYQICHNQQKARYILLESFRLEGTLVQHPPWNRISAYFFINMIILKTYFLSIRDLEVRTLDSYLHYASTPLA